MTTTAKTLLQAKYAENSQTTQYTAPANTRTIIDKFTATNATASSATLVVNVVNSGGAVGASNVVQQSIAIPAGTAELLSPLIGHVLNAGDFISTIAGTASAIVIRISGREVS